MKLLVMFSHAQGQSALPDLLRYHAAFGRERRSNASNAFCLKIMNGWMDLDDTYIYHWYWSDVKVDPRSRSQGQRSRSYKHLCEKIVWAITLECLDWSWWNFLWWSVMLRTKHCTRFIALSSGLRPRATLVRIKCFLPINHERMDGT